MTSQSRAIRSSSLRIEKFVKIMAQIFYNSESTCESTDVPTSINDRKSAVRPFDTINEILRSFSLVQSLLKGQNALILRIGNRGVIFCRASIALGKVPKKWASWIFFFGNIPKTTWKSLIPGMGCLKKNPRNISKAFSIFIQLFYLWDLRGPSWLR